jgi:hypothetical protein
MIPDAGIRRDAGWRDFWPLAAIAAAATLVGIYARFKGLGTWSFGPDEFYISRSIDNVLRSGLPEYLCGGYYTRGLVYQYAVAGLRLAVPARRSAIPSRTSNVSGIRAKSGPKPTCNCRPSIGPSALEEISPQRSGRHRRFFPERHSCSPSVPRPKPRHHRP